MKTLLGDVCAHCVKPDEAKSRYVRIGTAFADDGRLSFKIDALPRDGEGWTGWVNVFERKAGDAKKSKSDLNDDDIPF